MSDIVTFEIETNIPMPTGNASRYDWPFSRMSVGDSFVFFTSNPNANISVLAAARWRGVRIRTRKIEGGLRVWLIQSAKPAEAAPPASSFAPNEEAVAGETDEQAAERVARFNKSVRARKV